jgi:hypothetical protein
VSLDFLNGDFLKLNTDLMENTLTCHATGSLEGGVSLIFHTIGMSQTLEERMSQCNMIYVCSLRLSVTVITRRRRKIEEFCLSQTKALAMLTVLIRT